MWRFDEAEFRALAQARLLKGPPDAQVLSDDDLNPDASAMPFDGALRAAAVLVPVIARQPELTVLLTQRTDRLSNHAGQVAFPGGRIETGESILAAAIREAEEETGLASDFVEPLGFLDGYLTRTGFAVVPVVALVRLGFALDPHDGEVAAVFEVPLRFLMSEENHQRQSRQWQGRERRFYAMPYQDRHIWGATAGMIRNLHDRLYARP